MNRNKKTSFSALLLAIIGFGALFTTTPTVGRTRKKGAKKLPELQVQIDAPSPDQFSLPTIFTPTTPSCPELDRMLPEIKKAPIPALESLIKPWENGDRHELIEFNFDDAELLTLIHYVEERFGVTFILDSILNPIPQGGKNLAGIKISFKTNEPLSKKDAWGLFLTFVDMAGLAVVPGPVKNVLRLVTNDPRAQNNANNEPIPTLIGINPKYIPENNSLIRYVYFVHNASLDTITRLLDTLKSQTAPKLIVFPEVRGIIITDKAFNIKTMLEIIEELDKLSMPETMSIIKLQHADAVKVAEFYKSLVKEDEQAQQTFASRVAGNRKPQTLSYFPAGIRVIPEIQTNSIILLGSEAGIRKVEEFIVRELDKQNTLQHRFSRIYQLKHVQARAVANILTQAIGFKKGTDVANVGGVRDGDKYFKPMSIVAEESGNRLIITGDYEDYLKLVDIIQRIDIEQPQVGLKILIVNYEHLDNKDLGTQIRNKKPGITGLLGDAVNFQTSGLGGSSIVERPADNGATRLLGDLINLATGGAVGSTYMTLGSDAFGVWGMLRMLETYGNTNIVTNPFVVTMNNYTVHMGIGEKRRVKTSTTQGAGGPTTAFDFLDAKLDITITPRISYEGYVTLDINFEDTQFTSTDVENGNRIERTIRTSLILANNETAVLGGLLRTDSTDGEILGTPFARIPIIGWLLGKVKTQSKSDSSLIIFITPEIIPTDNVTIARNFTSERYEDITKTLKLNSAVYQKMDPVHSLFFSDAQRGQEILSEYMDKEGKYTYPSQKRELKRAARDKSLGDYL